ncbi:MAG: peptide chain release factor N(5)-glutamine methyltransferase [Candidatus Nanoperiomorbus sp.]
MDPVTKNNPRLSIADFLAISTKTLSKAGIASARLDSELILAHVLRRSREWLLAHDTDTLTQSQQRQARQSLLQRTQRRPIAYLTGRRDFYGHSFLVNEQVLVPRPESEVILAILDELAQDHHLRTVLDVGTGSGCLAISVKLTHPDLAVSACDISKSALLVARRNAARLLPSGQQIKFYQSDLLSGLPVSSRFDLIVANLPYLSPGQDGLSPELAYEPAIALYANDDGLSLIKQLITTVPAHLTPRGHLLLEMNTDQIETVASYATDYRYQVVKQELFHLLMRLAN